MVKSTLKHFVGYVVSFLNLRLEAPKELFS